MSDSMDDLRNLYQELILDHSRTPRNAGPLSDATHDAQGYNPLCGDKFTIHLRVGEGVVLAAGFEGAGCAISTASASLMTEVLRGKTVEEAEELFRRMHGLLTDGEVNGADLGKLAVFGGVREFPVRVKCATLPWHTMRAALKNQKDLVSTE